MTRTATVFRVIAETEGDEATKRRVCETLSRVFGGREVWVGEYVADPPAKVAGRMLASGMARREAIVALAERFGVTDRAARNYIAEALKWRYHLQTTRPG